MGHAHQSTEGHQGRRRRLHRAAKGQLISKGLFGVLDSSKKTNETIRNRSNCFRWFFG